jgi:SAM-dependent methyltransferase
MKVNLGCGNNILPGFINVDFKKPTLLDDEESFFEGDGRKLTSYFPAGSVDFILAEHFFEHLTDMEIRDILYRCFSVLKPKGTLTIVVPDAEQTIKNFAGKFVLLGVLAAKIFSTEEDTLHRSIWNRIIGTHYLECEGFFKVKTATEEVHHDGEVTWTFEAIKQ